MMQEQFKEAFDSIEVNEARVETINRTVLASMRTPQATKPRKHRAMMVAVAMACVLFASTSALLYFTPTVVVSVDINPSFEMEINRFDRVVDVNSYNDDGIALAKVLDITHMNYTEAVDALMASDTVTELMAQDGDLTIAVVPTKSLEQGDEIVAYVNQCTAQHQNAHCYTMSSDAHHQAHELGLSCGRYQAYEALVKMDAEVTPAQLNAMSMKEIRELMAENGVNGNQADSCNWGSGDGSCRKGGHHHGRADRLAE